MKLEGRVRRSYLSSLSLSPFREVVLPGNPFPVPIESAGRILGQHRTEDDRPRADLDAPVGPRSAHVGPHPARADRVDSNLTGGQFAGEDSGEGIHRDLRHRIGRWPAFALGFALLEVREIRVDKRVECGTSEGWIRESRAEVAPHVREFAEPTRHHDDAAA